MRQLGDFGALCAHFQPFFFSAASKKLKTSIDSDDDDKFQVGRWLAGVGGVAYSWNEVFSSLG